MEPHPLTPAEPLGLTVHSLPHPVDAATAQRTRRGRWSMILVALVCAAPVIASYFTYYVVRPSSRSSYGELIEAQPGIPALAVQAPDGSTREFQSLKGQWLLVSVGGGACDAVCQRHLYLQRQLRESLGKEKERLDWVWLIDDNAPVAAALEPALHTATVLRVPKAVLSTWLRPSGSHALEEHLYLVDPMGHWMLRFPAGLDRASAGRAKRDLDRVMRASASWDEPGR